MTGEEERHHQQQQPLECSTEEERELAPGGLMVLNGTRVQRWWLERWWAKRGSSSADPAMLARGCSQSAEVP